MRSREIPFKAESLKSVYNLDIGIKDPEPKINKTAVNPCLMTFKSVFLG